jgi:hypothetical protein
MAPKPNIKKTSTPITGPTVGNLPARKITWAPPPSKG